MLRGTVESVDNSLWVRQYKLQNLHITCSHFITVNIKTLISAALMCESAPILEKDTAPTSNPHSQSTPLYKLTCCVWIYFPYRKGSKIKKSSNFMWCPSVDALARFTVTRHWFLFTELGLSSCVNSWGRFPLRFPLPDLTQASFLEVTWCGWKNWQLFIWLFSSPVAFCLK